MNIDKIQQKNDGKDMKVIGDIGNGTDKVGYKLLTKTGEFKGKTDASGNLWLYPGNGTGGWLAWGQVGTGWQGFTSLP